MRSGRRQNGQATRGSGLTGGNDCRELDDLARQLRDLDSLSRNRSDVCSDAILVRLPPLQQTNWRTWDAPVRVGG